MFIKTKNPNIELLAIKQSVHFIFDRVNYYSTAESFVECCIIQEVTNNLNIAKQIINCIVNKDLYLYR